MKLISSSLKESGWHNEKPTLDTTSKIDWFGDRSRSSYWHRLGFIRWHLVYLVRSIMGFVPFGMERATVDDKHKIRKMLEYLGITHPAQQVEFMSALLDKPFNTSKMTRQDFYTLVTKIQNIQENRNKA